MKIWVVLIIIITSLTPCWADNDEIVAENINRVRACIKKNDLPKAKKILASDFDKYVKAYYSGNFYNNKETVIGFYNLEDICLYSGLISFIEGDYKKGGEYIEAAVGLINILWGKSWHDTLNNFIEDNERIFSKKSNSMKARLYHMVSTVYRAIGEEKNELKYLKKAYGLNSNNFELIVSLGQHYFLAGELETSQKYFLKALTLNPNDAQPLSGIAIIAGIKGDSEKAFKSIEKAAKIDPNNLEIRINHALILYMDDRSGEAEKLNAETIRKFPDNKDHLERVSLYFLLDQKKYREAYEIVKKISGKELTSHNVLTALVAITYAFNRDESRAKLMAKRMVTEYPDCKKDEFLKDNWFLRRDIYKKFKELISQ
ncbi:MAG: hypothetical protein FJ110_08065 [Deltaproteobacteria bacterium]|nr:hypothetical protein [Deltaproteobacteria bacterium]